MDVSIVIPAYNMERWLERAVRAAQATQGVSYEILIVDDGSTDRTLAMAQQFAEADPSIRVIEMDRNRGLSAARNAGIAASQGTWIAHLDADDWWLPERLERLTDVGTRLGADVVADDNFLIYDGSDTPWARMLAQYGETSTEPHFITPEYFAARHWVLHPIYRRGFLTDTGITHDVEVMHGEDFLAQMESLCKGARFLVVPEAYYFYVTAREGSITRQQRHVADMERVLARTRQFAVDAGRTEAVRALDDRAQTLGRWIAYNVLVRTVRARDFGGALRLAARTPLPYWRGYAADALTSIKVRARRAVGRGTARRVPDLVGP